VRERTKTKSERFPFLVSSERELARATSTSAPRQTKSDFSRGRLPGRDFASTGCKDSNTCASLDSALQLQVSLLRTKLLQLVVDRIDEVSRLLHE
jgi:hypothetical protein